MEANDLRVGNLIMIRHGSFGYKESFVCAHTFTNGSLSFSKSIPLTEDWMVKFGLRQERLTEFDANIGCWYTFNGFRFLFKYDANQRIHNGVLGIEIKHVHQLQNLYFALTGEELNLKND